MAERAVVPNGGRPEGWVDPRQSELKDGLRKLAAKRVVNLNKEIAEHARAKQLAEARRCFANAVELGVANNYTYTNMLNAFVRCGDVSGAARLFERMKAGENKPCVFAYTTLIKGLCGASDIHRAGKKLAEMERQQPPVTPNIRTVNTFLRGCLLAGAVRPATRTFRRLPDWSVAPDGSTYEYMVALLTQSLQLEQANAVAAAAAKAAKAGEGFEVNTAQLQLSLARAAAMLGEWETARRSVNLPKTSMG